MDAQSVAADGAMAVGAGLVVSERVAPGQEAAVTVATMATVTAVAMVAAASMGKAVKLSFPRKRSAPLGP